MQRHFDAELANLKRRLLHMSALAETMIAEALEVLVNRREEFIPLVRQREEEVNALQRELDEACLEMIALHQPTAGDLRFILGVAKTNADLERLADQAVNILNKAERLLHQPPLQPFAILSEMADIARGMLKDSLHAFVNRDVAQARAVLQRDDELDARKSRITVELATYMTRDPSTVSRALDLVLVARNLERIGDHATNIAENTIFVVEGRDVRHHAEADTAPTG